MTFPFKTRPMSHQILGFDLAKDFDNFALFMEQGLGKSKLSIDLLRYKCFLNKRVLKTLIVCPKIALKNWQNELNKHSNIGKYSVVVIGNKAQRLRKLSDPSKRIFIINFESALATQDALVDKEFDVLIVDESSKVKNHKAKQAKALKSIGHYAKHAWLLSGTPILNSPIDIYMQFLIMDKGETFGNNFFSFRNTYFEDKNAGIPKAHYYPDWRPRPGALEILKNKINTKAYIRKKSECLDLPPKVYQEYYLEMEKDQLAAYNDMVTDMITFFDNNIDNPVIANTAMTKMIRLNQITSGFVKTDDEGQEGKIIGFKKNPKLEAVKELLETLHIEHKVIIWAVFRYDIKLLAKELSCYNPAVIYGDTKDKFAEQDKFRQDPTCRVCIANPASAGIAINLVEADYVIYYSQGYSLEHRLQSEARNHRIGSENHEKITYIDLLFKGSVDELIVTKLRAKEDLANKLIDVMKFLKDGR